MGLSQLERVSHLGDIPAHPAGRGPARAQAVSAGAGAALCRRSELGAAADVRAAGASRTRRRTRSSAMRGRATGWPARRPAGRPDQRPGQPAASRAPRGCHRPFRLSRGARTIPRCSPRCSRPPRLGCRARGMRRVDRAVQPVDQRRERPAGRGLRHAALDDDGPRAALLRPAGRGAGLPQGQGPDRLRCRRRSALADATQAHDRAR